MTQGQDPKEELMNKEKENKENKEEENKENNKNNENNEETEKQTSFVPTTLSTSWHRSRVKKLRIMVQAGVPLGAVEQKAKLDGIDMNTVLGTNNYDNYNNNSANGTNNNSTNNNSTNNNSTNNNDSLPTPLIKKYKRMIKCGVPLMAVQAQAYAEGRWTPDQVVDALTDVLDLKRHHHHHNKNNSSSSSNKNNNNNNTDENNDEPNHPPSTSCIPNDMNDINTYNNNNNNTTNHDKDKTQSPVYFIPSTENANVAFPHDSHLTALVRQMVHTVQKKSHTINNAKNIDTTTTMMVVDNLTLYHALGALQSVQRARDSYNCTLNTIPTPSSDQEINVKRQAFIEIAHAIGMKLPNDEENCEDEDEAKIYIDHNNYNSNATTVGGTAAAVHIRGLDELVQFIEETYETELSTLRDMVRDGWYDFDTLALLYTPGSKVVAKNVCGGGGVDMLCQVVWNRYEQGRTIMGRPTKYFKVCFQYVVAVSASQATLAEVVEGMESFEGKRQIHSTAMTFRPLASYSEKDQSVLLHRYRRRGEMYNDIVLRGKHSYMSYDKGCFFLKRAGTTTSLTGNVNTSAAAALSTGGRIVIDTQGAYDNGHSLSVGYDPMIMGIKYKFKEYSLHMRAMKHDSNNHNAATHAHHRNDDAMILFDQVPNGLLDMVWPSVVGFSLTAKAWGDVLVDGLEEIQWQEDIFDRLVLPESRKMMVKALVRHSTDSFQDLVQGKGEGTVFLMYGPPGVGKTLTAEAVAELLHKPLYSLSLGTLGTTPGELEQRLGQIMNMSAKWDALILLDEADSFLETRSANSSLERNAMVSVMLKLVEYFSGILFLTSNRMDSLDPAFQTRITLALRYEPLDVDARTQVWKNLLMKSGFHVSDGCCNDDRGIVGDFSGTGDGGAGDIDPVALAKACCLNGREIKNALRLAMAMAAEKNEPLSQAILLETVDIVNDYKSAVDNIHNNNNNSSSSNSNNNNKVIYPDETAVMLESQKTTPNKKRKFFPFRIKGKNSTPLE